MKLPVNPPVLPMLAKRVDTLPDGDGWIYEPKWDGFRVRVSRGPASPEASMLAKAGGVPRLDPDRDGVASVSR